MSWRLGGELIPIASANCLPQHRAFTADLSGLLPHPPQLTLLTLQWRVFRCRR